MQFIDPEKKKRNGKSFTRSRKNHRKCDNKNEIYELRLVIYLCANSLLQKNKRGRIGGGCDIIMSLESGKSFQEMFFPMQNDKLSAISSSGDF